VLAVQKRIGDTLLLLDQLSAAEEVFKQVSVSLETRFGATHPSVAAAYMGLGRVAELRELLPAAQKHYERALSLRQATLSKMHMELGGSHAAMGRVLFAQRAFADALPHAESALAIHEHGLGEQALVVADDLVLLANIKLGLYQRLRGVETLKQALSIYKAGGAMQPRGNEVVQQLKSMGVPLK
jgi:tetratricopeptide (TPR) repeat protein